MLGSLVLGPAVLIICVRGFRPLSAFVPNFAGFIVDEFAVGHLHG